MDQLEELRPIQFAQVPNEAADTLPDLNSIGLLTVMLRHAPGYGFTIADLIDRKGKIPGPKLGKATAYGAMTVLIEHGWAARVKYRCAGGHFHTSIFRTGTRFTLTDLRRIAEKFTKGTEKIIHCKGCSKDPEIPVRTRIRAGATIQSFATKAEYAPITDLFDDPDSTAPGSAAPASGNREAGAREARDAEAFNKTEEEHESSSSSGDAPDPTPSQEPRAEEEDEQKPTKTKKRPSAAGIVSSMTGATPEEAQGVIDRLAAAAERQGRPIAAMARYIRGCDVDDLARHLAAVRAEAAPAPDPASRKVRCRLHRSNTVPCAMCVLEARDPDPRSRERLEEALRVQGPQVRRDLVALLGAAPTPAA